MRQAGAFISFFFFAWILMPPPAQAWIPPSSSAQAQTDLACKKGKLSEKLLFSAISHNRAGQISFHQVRKPRTLSPEEKEVAYSNKDKNPDGIHVVLSSKATGVYLRKCVVFVKVFRFIVKIEDDFFIVVPTAMLFDEYKAYLDAMRKRNENVKVKSLMTTPPLRETW